MKIRRSLATAVLGLAATGALVSGFTGSAEAQTREHVLLARQTPVPRAPMPKPTGPMAIKANTPGPVMDWDYDCGSSTWCIYDTWLACWWNNGTHTVDEGGNVSCDTPGD